MRADSAGARGTGLLLALALLSNACASLTPPPGREMYLRYTPHEATGPAVAGGPGPVTAAGPGGAEGTARQSALAAHLAFRGAMREVSGSTRRLSGEFNATAERVRTGMRNTEKVMLLAQLLERVTMVSAMKFSLPASRPSAPATLGMGMVVGSNGVTMGTRMVVSAEWVEMMRRLVRAGVLSLLRTVAKRMQDYGIPMDFTPWRGP
jgi:hypothetical protein